MTIRRLFIANRGEIAVRIIRTAQQLGIETVLGVSTADRDSLGARMATRVVVLGPAPAQQSYLDAPRVVHAAKATGCQALHPGYGFLSEKPQLARLCDEAGVIFVGPTAECIETLGDKLSARQFAMQAGVAMVPGTELLESVDAAIAAAEQIGFPLVMKASAGGGGKGMFRKTPSVMVGFTWSDS
jgi:acetyl-CoA carboxylase, biotin carboxylase subunit